MKIRQGFVSNSSSSSFCIMGIELPDEPMEMLKEILEIDDEFIFRKMSENDVTETVEKFCSKWLREVIEDKGVDIHYLGYEDESYGVVGHCVDSGEYLGGSYSIQKEYEKAREIVEKAGLSGEIRLFLETSY